jgi:hypothetical protein
VVARMSTICLQHKKQLLLPASFSDCIKAWNLLI